VIDRALGGRLALAAGFRNILVHGYIDIDDAQTLSHLDDLDDLDGFIDAVVAWMEAERQH
jgi:uncharacterized protein YutE (UPF0331/DUF86 family)